MTGAGQNHKQWISAMREDIHHIITQNLSDESARMEWKHYWQNVVKQCQVIIKGWPDNIPFHNLSETSISLSDLETLYQKWHCGGIYWKKLSSKELQDLDLQCNHQIEWVEAEASAP
ncbi:hypothetical protein L208DRAFT_1327891 [Tricholoma matsutake]|nr:hypothetical protein L208DRAFT_1327891 [Tricholoma matsutake 945]